MIQPLKSTNQGEHAIFTYNQEELDPARHKCGVRHVGRKESHIRTSRSLKGREVSAVSTPSFISAHSEGIVDTLVCSTMTGKCQACTLSTYSSGYFAEKYFRKFLNHLIWR
jgi:hypothetical protein